MYRVALICVLLITLTGCADKDNSMVTLSPTQVSQIPKTTPDMPTPQVTPELLPNPTSVEAQSLENIATKDAEKYINALKKEDTQLMSRIMAHAENENTPETMKIIIEGFLLHFDKLTDLNLTYESNEQNEEYFIENFVIIGMKKGEERFVPFQVKYDKNDGITKIQDDRYREPLYDSPLLNHPYIIRNAEGYLQAIRQEDVESLLLHLGLYNVTEEIESDVSEILNRYREQLDLTTTKVIPINYDENRNLFLFDFQDDKERSHSIQVDADTSLIVDDWALGQ